MANKVRGEVEFQSSGEDYVLLLDFNALCDLEDDFPGLMDGQAEMKSPKAIRRVFHAGLAAHHPNIDERGAGEIIHAVGLAKAADLVRESFAAAFPKPEEGKREARPPKASVGAGSER